MAMDFKVEATRILSLENHPNADRLELAQVKGWQCVVQKGVHKVGDLIVYIPIESILPEVLEALIFGLNSKVRLSNHRVRTIKLRGAISQGLVIERELVEARLGYQIEDGDNLTAPLGITKYEPQTPKFQQGTGRHAKRTYKNPHFREYVDLANFKNYPELFQPEDEVVITEKIHGTNFRAGWVPFVPNTWWRRLQKWLGFAPNWVFVYGSRRVQISEKAGYDGFYEKNIYAEAVIKYKLEEVIPKGRLIFGEVYGTSIQKDYDYGLTNERRLIVFDVMDSQTGEYLDARESEVAIMRMGLPQVPTLFRGHFGKAPLKMLIEGSSILSSSQKVREGCVIKSVREEHSLIGRKMLKAINPAYLLSDPTEFH